MRKKQSSSKLQTFTYIMLILASVIIISCGAYFLYEKYETHKQTEEKSSKKKHSICFEDTICFFITYKLIGQNLYYEVHTIHGLKYIKEKYKDYYRDRFVDNNHEIKWKKYFEEEVSGFNNMLALVYTKEFELDKFKNIIRNLKEGFSSDFLTLSLRTKDNIELKIHDIILNNTSNSFLQSVKKDWKVGYQSTEKLNLTEEEAKNFHRLFIMYYEDIIDAIVEKY